VTTLEKEKLKRKLGHSNIFTTKQSLKEAENFLLSIAVGEHAQPVMLATFVYHNSFVEWLVNNYDVTPKGVASEEL